MFRNPGWDEAIVLSDFAAVSAATFLFKKAVPCRASSLSDIGTRIDDNTTVTATFGSQESLPIVLLVKVRKAKLRTPFIVILLALEPEAFVVGIKVT